MAIELDKKLVLSDSNLPDLIKEFVDDMIDEGDRLFGHYGTVSIICESCVKSHRFDVVVMPPYSISVNFLEKNWTWQTMDFDFDNDEWGEFMSKFGYSYYGDDLVLYCGECVAKKIKENFENQETEVLEELQHIGICSNCNSEIIAKPFGDFRKEELQCDECGNTELL